MNGQGYSLFLVVFYTYVLPFVIMAVSYSIWRIGINTFEIQKSLKQLVDIFDSDIKKNKESHLDNKD